MVELKNITKKFYKKSETITALNDVSLSIGKGDVLLIKGPSGSGKTSLLFCIAGMLFPDLGSVHINSINMYALVNNMRTAFRAREIGFIFQLFYLIPYLNILENVLLAPLTDKSEQGKLMATQIINDLGLGNRIHHKPHELSVGEKQRVALARTMLYKPSIILADEPTANLDRVNAIHLIRFLKEYHSNDNTIILVSHDEYSNNIASKEVYMNNGILTT